ncbi:MAG: heavy-metal-associated domain-containing protein [Ruminococcaceae bacterium]|jgi:copper chaperone CopZ|nr:heavy-metal-associated domain-containing protein [Oscillospiraceae bacterium]
MGWINYVLVAAIAAAAMGGIYSLVKHAKGQGDCCGGGGNIVDSCEKKTLEGPALGRYILHVEGMHCDNCRRTVERRLDKFDGAVCRVDLNRKTATVTYDRPVDPEQLRLAVTMMDYQVTGIDREEV